MLPNGRQEPFETELPLLLLRKRPQQEQLDLRRKAGQEIIHRQALQASPRIGKNDAFVAGLKKHRDHAVEHEQCGSLHAAHIRDRELHKLRGEAGHGSDVAAGMQRRLAVGRHLVRQNPTRGLFRKFLLKKLRQHPEASNDLLQRSVLRG